MTSMLRPLLLLALWLGLNGFIVFVLQLCLGIFSPWLTLILSIALLGYLIFKYPIKVTVTFEVTVTFFPGN